VADYQTPVSHTCGVAALGRKLCEGLCSQKSSRSSTIPTRRRQPTRRNWALSVLFIGWSLNACWAQGVVSSGAESGIKSPGGVYGTAGDTLAIELAFTPEGQMCQAVIVPCHGRLGLWDNIQYPEVVDRLAPSADRGALLPKLSSGDLGNCNHWRRDEYEKVTIFTDANECNRGNHITIRWKGRNCVVAVRPGQSALCSTQGLEK
jgi:hypothetical protein